MAWHDMLRASGEAVPDDDARKRKAAERRYCRRVEALETARYLAPQAGRGEAPAGDSVEIVKIVRGARHRPAGLVIRASARFVEAQRRAEAQEWERIPAGRLVLPAW